MERTKQRKITGTKGRKRSFKDHSTHPIKDASERKALLDFLKAPYDSATTAKAKLIADRNWMVVMLGMYSALRAEDLLQMRVDQIDFKEGEVSVYEAKTRKYRKIWVADDCLKELKAYCIRNGFQGDDHIFPSRQSRSRIFKEGITTQTDEPCVTKRRMEEVIEKARRAVGIRKRVGLHGLRKTFGYCLKTQLGLDIEDIRHQYGHSNSSVTERYIDWTKEDSQTRKPKFLKMH